MIKLNITLGNTIFSLLYLPYSNDAGIVMPKIFQHRIVLSEKLISYYVEFASKNGYRDLCQARIQDLVQSVNRCKFENVCDEDDVVKEMINLAMKQPMKILVAEKTEIKKANSKVNLLDCKQILENVNCILNLYCIPVTSRYVEPKKNVKSYTKWLKNWLSDEKDLIIRDNYLLTDHGLESFNTYYLPSIEKGAHITIHTCHDVEQKYIDEFDKEKYDDYQINIYKCDSMHERVIILKELQIVIGKGLDFLRPDREWTDESFISISKITMDARKTEIQQLR